MKKSVLLIFGKYPERGKVKTRIAVEAGEDFAYEISNACLSDLIDRIRNFDGSDFYFVADSEYQAELFEKRFGITSIILDNQEITLSEKFNQVFTKAFSLGYERVMLIPTDLPFFSKDDLESAFNSLDENDYVFGPENNGGVYLMGVKSPYKKDIFSGVRWSTENSLKDLIRNTSNEAEILSPMDDLNTLDDVLKNAEIMEKICPNISGVLKKFLLIKQSIKAK